MRRVPCLPVASVNYIRPEVLGPSWSDPGGLSHAPCSTNRQPSCFVEPGSGSEKVSTKILLSASGGESQSRYRVGVASSTASAMRNIEHAVSHATRYPPSALHVTPSPRNPSHDRLVKHRVCWTERRGSPRRTRTTNNEFNTRGAKTLQSNKLG